MSCKEISKLAPEEREEFKDYLQLHMMSQGESLWEVMYKALAQDFPVIEENEGMPLSSGPLTPKNVWWVPTTLVTPRYLLELDIPPIQTPKPSPMKNTQ